jgi:hypothetical protein
VNPVEIRSWLNWVGSTSVPLCRIKPNTDRVLGIASAWLLDIGEKRILITAAHSVLKGVDWAVDLGPDSEGRNELYWPDEFAIIDGPDLDLSAAKVTSDLQPFHQERGPRGMVGEPIAYHIFVPSEIVRPDLNEVFAFSGKISPELHADNSFFRRPIVYPGLRLVEHSAHKLTFRLPVEHPGHDAFQGCSGAPILDSKRRCIGHVTGGNVAENIIFGSSFEDLVPLLGVV